MVSRRISGKEALANLDVRFSTLERSKLEPLSMLAKPAKKMWQELLFEAKSARSCKTKYQEFLFYLEKIISDQISILFVFDDIFLIQNEQFLIRPSICLFEVCKRPLRRS